MVTVPFLDLGRLHASIRQDLDDAIARVVDSSGFVGSGASRSFETSFATLHGLVGAVGCGSGTDA